MLPAERVLPMSVAVWTPAVWGASGGHAWGASGGHVWGASGVRVWAEFDGRVWGAPDVMAVGSSFWGESGSPCD